MLSVRSVHAGYGDFQVLHDVSIDVGEGELVLLVGPNGHGKSTLLKTVTGLVAPTSGAIRWRGEPIHCLRADRIAERGVVYVAEDRHLFPAMSVHKNLLLGAYNRNARSCWERNLERVYELFPRLRERAGQAAATLSGGEARMVAIGRGMMANAGLMALDEPSLGLSPIMRSEMFAVVRTLNREGMSILLVEQAMPKNFDNADRVYLMEEGQITFSGGYAEFMGDDSLRTAILGM